MSKNDSFILIVFNIKKDETHEPAFKQLQANQSSSLLKQRYFEKSTQIGQK